jgi:acyl dehydratase
MKTFNGIEDLKASVGQEVGVSEWQTVDQAEIDRFADATGDHQWIHVDPERARDTPFGSTIAHGLYTLSIGPKLMNELFTVDKVAFALNYGYGKVRFPSPLPVDSKVRMRATLSNVEDVGGGVQVTITQTFEREGGEKPVCVAEALARFYAAS